MIENPVYNCSCGKKRFREEFERTEEYVYENWKPCECGENTIINLLED